MTFASVPVLARHASQTVPDATRWLSRVLTSGYDPRALPIAQKRAALIGMGMTERQGGSDVRANTTRAEPDCGRRVSHHGSQVVLLGAAVRCAPAPRARRGRPRLLSVARA
jgi:alkylation response protein AidB-like acyl-CoA dehydrogenase